MVCITLFLCGQLGGTTRATELIIIFFDVFKHHQHQNRVQSLYKNHTGIYNFNLNGNHGRQTQIYILRYTKTILCQFFFSFISYTSEHINLHFNKYIKYVNYISSDSNNFKFHIKKGSSLYLSLSFLGRTGNGHFFSIKLN